MLVRTEDTKNDLIVLVVDELNKFLGVIDLEDFITHCVTKKETLEMDDYTYYYTNKEKLIKYLK